MPSTSRGSGTSFLVQTNMEAWVGHPLDPISVLFDTLLEASKIQEELPTNLGEILADILALIPVLSKIRYSNALIDVITTSEREGSGSVVEYLTRDRGVAGSSLTGITVL